MKKLLIALALLMSRPVYAEEVGYKVNFTKPLNDLNGKPIERTAEIPMRTLGEFIAVALMSTLPSETPAPTPIEKERRYLLALKVRDQWSTELVLKRDEIERIKTVVGLYYSPLIVGQVYTIIDPEIK